MDKLTRRSMLRPACSHQAISSSRQNPESPRSVIFTSGQAWRICAMIRFSSSTHPAEPSMLEVRSRAHSKKSPQKMYSGR